MQQGLVPGAAIGLVTASQAWQAGCGLCACCSAHHAADIACDYKKAGLPKLCYRAVV
jgi:hypothetical protein